jgi:hypothetical protein
MDLSLLSVLKERLIQAKQFSEVWEYFMDHFGENRQFLVLGERVRHALLEDLITQMAKKLCDVDVKVEDILLKSLAEQQFFHGGVISPQGEMINVLYFDDIDMGTLAVASIRSPMTTVARFSVRLAPDPSNN